MKGEIREVHQLAGKLIHRARQARKVRRAQERAKQAGDVSAMTAGELLAHAGKTWPPAFAFLDDPPPRRPVTRPAPVAALTPAPPLPYRSKREIVAARRALGLTQEGLARAIGVTVSTVNRWENGHAKPYPLARRMLAMLVEQGAVQR